MDLATQLTAHLQALSRRPEEDASKQVCDVTVGLESLARTLTVEIPCCLSVSIVLSLPVGRITVTLPTPAVFNGGAVDVRSSLAVPMDTAAGAALLLLQAARAGAFVLLADDLTAQRPPGGTPLQLDEHLAMLAVSTGDRLAVELADLRDLAQAVGALIDQGWLPSQARQELHDRARAAQLPAPQLARQLLAGLPGRRPPL